MSTGSSPSDYYLFSIEFPERSAPVRGRSIMDLYRNYSIGGLVGFIGSGASVSLGYDTWKSFARKMGEYVVGEAGKKIPTTQLGSEERLHLEKLSEALKNYTAGIADASVPELFDVLALCGELAELLGLKFVKDEDDDKKNVGAAALPAKDATPGANPAEKQNSSPEGMLSLAGFYRKRFEIKSRLFAAEMKLDEVPDSPVDKLVRDIYEEYLKKIVNHTDGPTPMPADYASGEALLRSLSRTAAREENRPVVPAEPSTLLTERRPTLDVLGCLRNGWKIFRYVTLNYDHEIERTLEDYSFPFYSLTPDTRPGLHKDAKNTGRLAVVEPVKHFADARSRLGERALSIDLCPENMGDLILFATNFSSARLQVLHLHGSVRDPNTMIVSDRDYNARYYVDNGWSSVLEDGQTMLFRGNGIVFIGVGMNEDELLRPLRILAQSAGGEGHPVFTFLASEGEHKDTALAIKLYQRYGIRSIFYGTKLGEEKEFGDFKTHPLVAAWHELEGSYRDCTSPDSIGLLKPLPFELSFLKLLSNAIGSAIKTLPDTAAAAAPEGAKAKQSSETAPSSSTCETLTPAQELDSQLSHLKQWFADHMKLAEINEGFDIKSLSTEKLPRLLLTPWHSHIFELVLRCVLSLRTGCRFDLGQLTKLSEAVRGLDSAIRTRALADGLSFVVDRASNWRRRWTYSPKHGSEEKKGPAFRRLPERKLKPGDIVRRHICLPQPLDEEQPGFVSQEPGVSALSPVTGAPEGTKREPADAKGLVPRCRTDTEFRNYVDATECDHQAREALRSGSPLVICDWSIGKGKGRAASVIAAMEAGGNSQLRRAIIVFSQSCEFDSCFDLIAELVKLADEDDAAQVQCILVQADLVFSKNTSVPKLAEWDVVLRLLVDAAMRKADRVKVVVFCEYPETRDYFLSLVPEQTPDVSGKIRGKKKAVPDLYHRIAAPEVLRADTSPRSARAKVIRHIIRRCKSRWVALFLTRIVARICCNDSCQELLEDVCHGLRLVQDPRQRVALVVDTAMNHLERYIIAEGKRDERLHKIMAHAIMRHLYALGVPVRREVLLHCPEIKKIFFVYGAKAEERQIDLLDQSVELLLDLRLILQLRRHVEHPGNLRLGLHGSTRDYLASKKNLPFTRVQGREQAALTVLAVLAEEVLPLEADDFKFLGDLFDALVAVYEVVVETDQILAVDCIRAAFGLLRGSMRIGVVLRATPSATEQAGPTPLDKYFLRLLAIRLATLRVVDLSAGADPYAWPLYEREWVWLFNEMGVVRMLQGNIHDAIPLLEQASNFEEARLLDAQGYESLIYPAKKPRRFSVSRLRIFINLSAAALERGAFGRVSRIAERDLSTLRKRLRDLVPENRETAEMSRSAPRVQERTSATPEAKHQARVQRVLAHADPHRELRILILACELTNTRVQYLSGAIGSAERWLRRNREGVLGVGVHGLTASFFKVFADVKQRKGDSVRAAKYLSIARAEAEASGRPDIILGVMLAEAEQARDLRTSGSTLLLRHHLGRLRKIESEAKRFGMSHIEATACLVRSRLYLGFGEHRSAREDVMRVLTLTMVNGLRVKRISALIVMAALLAADESSATPRGEALQMVEAARREAERMGYKLAAVNAMELEIVLTRRGSIEDWATSRVASAADSPNASVSQG